VGVGDFNADGKSDLAVSDGLNLYALWNNGNFSFSKVQLVSTGTCLHVFANSQSSAQITALQVYIDGRLIYNDTSGATYVDTAFTVSKGTHSITVKAWDANGNAFRQARAIMAQ
jgi:hypothetical protein